MAYGCAQADAIVQHFPSPSALLRGFEQQGLDAVANVRQRCVRARVCGGRGSAVHWVIGLMIANSRLGQIVPVGHKVALGRALAEKLRYFLTTMDPGTTVS
jgi:hypothetical protein